MTVSLPPVTQTTTLIVNTTQPTASECHRRRLHAHLAQTTFSAFQSAATGWYYDAAKQDLFVRVARRAPMDGLVGGRRRDDLVEQGNAFGRDDEHRPPRLRARSFVDDFLVEATRSRSTTSRSRKGATTFASATAPPIPAVPRARSTPTARRSGGSRSTNATNWDTWGTATLLGTCTRAKRTP